jgi:hydroxymethylglutaryl-CoA lyase
MEEPVKLIECPRDAWQGLGRQIPTELKVRYLRTLIGAGFRHLDAVSFVSPKAVPQMSDSEAVLKSLGGVGDVEIIGIVVNEQGAKRAIATGAVTTLGFPCSVSETFLRRNQNQSRSENLAGLQGIKQLADEAGLAMVAYISMAFGNPYGDRWREEDVVNSAVNIAALDVPAISLADTVGAAAPAQIISLLKLILAECARSEVGIHLHSTRAEAGPKILAAYDAGCRRFDSAMGGLGGCPFAQDDLVGNLPTEEVWSALEKRGAKMPTLTGKAEITALNAVIAADFG